MGRLSSVPSRLGRARTAAPATVARKSAAERGYDHRWHKASAAFLVAHPLCRGCLAMGRTEAAVLTDHVVPHRGDMRRFWDRAWWQASCRWHHDAVKQHLERAFDLGLLTAEDLWLDSPLAREAARALAAGEGWGGVESLVGRGS